MSTSVLKVSYNKQCIPFPEWILLFTLCLAPLIAHIASGTLQPSYLTTETRPRWYDRVCHYHPTSILWRYAAIADRCIRAISWNNMDMAATNAFFWTSKGWDGSENMVNSATPHCTHCPESPRVEILSVTMLKTLIVTMQGVAAVYSLIGSLIGTGSFVQQMGVDLIFFPVAILGLLRFCAAAWLTENFSYTLRNDAQLNPLPRIPKTVDGKEVQRVDTIDVHDPLNAYGSSSHRFKPTSHWPSRIFRAFWWQCVGSGPLPCST